MSQLGSSKIYSVPCNNSFLDCLAEGIIKRLSSKLERTLVILPNQLSCSFLYQSFLKFSVKSLILPKIIPISNIDNIADPYKNLSDFLELPQNFDLMEIKLFIWEVFNVWKEITKISLDETEFCNDVLSLFCELEEMEYDIYECVDHIIISNLTSYQKLLIKFLKYFVPRWCEYKQAYNKISFIEKRNKIVHLRGKNLDNLDGFDNIILAGTTGINLCTKGFIQKILKHPKGIFIYHDLLDLDNCNITESHPNFSSKLLLETISSKQNPIWFDQDIVTTEKITKYIETDNIYQESNLICKIIQENQSKNLHTTVITNNLDLKKLILLKTVEYIENKKLFYQDNAVFLAIVTTLKIIDLLNNKSSLKQLEVFFTEYYIADHNIVEQIEIFRSLKQKKSPELIIKIFSYISSINSSEIHNIELLRLSQQIRKCTKANFDKLERTLNYLIEKDSANIYCKSRDFTIIHPKDARLKKFEYTLISDLNESSWSTNVLNVLNNQVFKTFLSFTLKELRKGQVANDFLRHRDSKNLILTRSTHTKNRQDIPYFWLKKINYDLYYYNDIENSVSHNVNVTVLPEAQYRIHDFSVTQIEKLLKNPYSIYALKILELEPLHVFSFEYENKVFGITIHKVIDLYVKNYQIVSENGYYDYLLGAFKKEIAKFNFKNSIIKSWYRRFHYIAKWIIEQHRINFEASDVIYSEHKTKIALKNISIKANIDRIEHSKDGFKIIDYKTGSKPALHHIKLGLSPQLILEAYICLKFFKHIELDKISLEYWQLKGKKQESATIYNIKEASNLIKLASEKIENIILEYQNSKTPIIAFPNENYLPEYDDYYHLARRDKSS